MENYHIPLLQGCVTSAGLIIAIGAQNAFVIKQGLMKNQVFITALFCALVDSSLIAVGVGGLGEFLTSNQILLQISNWGGAAFLFWYGFRAFRSSFRSQNLTFGNLNDLEKPSLKETLITLSIICFLNPHVYLDTVVLLGSIGSQLTPLERPFFAVGAMISSFIWFFGVCYGARLLAPIFEKPIAWKILDFIIGCIMWGIGLSLLLYSPGGCAA
jgi:L-lysine exporter family protein LysE/ArgO